MEMWVADRWGVKLLQVGVESSHTATANRWSQGGGEEKASVGGGASWELAATSTKC